MALLATTALEWSWGRDEPLVFLGEWCRRHDRRSLWQLRAHTVVRNHWDDRGKLRSDQIYLRALHDALLGDLTRTLGQLHGIERSRRFWQTLLDPWLGRYLGVAYDRWECLRVAFEEHGGVTSIARSRACHGPTRDHVHFQEQIAGDDWNHDFFGDILRFEYSDRCVILAPEGAVEPRESVAGRDISGSSIGSRRSVAALLDRVSARLTRSNRVALIRAYFPLPALVRLNLRIGQVPCAYLDEFGWPDARMPLLQEVEAKLRDRLSTSLDDSRRFEAFLGRRMIGDLPQILVESFDWARARVAAIRLRPRIVLTANAHWFNDLFKHWVAEKVERDGVIFVTMTHGSGIPSRYDAMGFEESIAHVTTTWSRPHHPKHVQLPANKLVSTRRALLTGSRLVVIGSEVPRYPFDAACMPHAGQILAGFEMICRMYDALEQAAKSAFLVKPYPEQGWHLRERLASRLGPEKVTTDPNLQRVMNRARLVVCTYPQTTLSEAMARAGPTLLVYPREYWETHPQFDGLLEALHSARIAFFDGVAAAAHINEIWHEPAKWWETATVRAARRRYLEEAMGLRPDWLAVWARFIRDLPDDTGVRSMRNGLGMPQQARDAPRRASSQAPSP